MKFQGISNGDFKILRDLKNFNKINYKKILVNKKKKKYLWKYKTKSLQFEARDKNRIVFDKMVALMQYIKDDTRFKNFKIGMCGPKSQAGKGKFGDYRSGIWIWMVANKWLKNIPIKKGKIGPRFKIPQIQIDITPNGFTTAEIWYEKTAFNHLNKFIKRFEGKFTGDSKINLFCWKENKDKTIFDRNASKNNFNLFCNKLKNGSTNEAAIYKFIENDYVSNNSDLIEQVKTDLLYLIKNYYEPVYGNVINKINTGKKGAYKVDIERKKRIEIIGYDIVTEHFEKIGYEVKPVFEDNLGWDLEATLNKEKLLLEVKGLSGEIINVELTPNEYEQLRKNKRNYRVCIVTNALIKPSLHVFSYRGINGWVDQHGYILLEKIRKALKMYIE